MNPLIDLIYRHRQGAYPVFAPGPFISILSLRANGLKFDGVLKDAEDMAAAASLNFDLGFEAAVVPFDMNVEAEIIGCQVNYHEEVGGVPVYPTIGERWIETADDFDLPEDVARAGRVPAVTAAIGLIKRRAAASGAVGVFLPGPFTLAGQVLNPERMFVTVLKKPDIMRALLAKLTELLIRVRGAYVAAGADFVIIEEGGATSISPKSFKSLILPELKRLLEDKSAPHVLSLAGRSDRYVPFMLEAGADGIGVDQACDIARVVQELPAGFPLLATCGAFDMLAAATPAEIQAEVQACLDRGVTFASPPADIYPPAKLENIQAFVNAHRTYRKKVKP